MSVISEREGRYLCAQHLSIAQAVCSVAVVEGVDVSRVLKVYKRCLERLCNVHAGKNLRYARGSPSTLLLVANARQKERQRRSC